MNKKLYVLVFKQFTTLNECIIKTRQINKRKLKKVKFN